ncbi:MAG: ATP-binding protein [Bacillota bacterium]|nr:ATP-binding protein [Bacillota bacterium]
MEKKIHNHELPLYRKILLFSFFITFLVMLSTAGVSFYSQTDELKSGLTEQAVGVASLWSATISPDDLKKAIKIHDKNELVIRRLKDIVSMVHDRESSLLEGYLISANCHKNNKVTIIASSDRFENLGLGIFKQFSAGPEFLTEYKKAFVEKKITSTRPYHDSFGYWITAFSPVIDRDGKVAGILAIDVDASKIESYKRKLAAYLFFSFIGAMVIVYFTLKWGLRRVLSPVGDIIQGMNAVSAGDFNVRLQIKDQSELMAVSQRFNLMTEQLSLLFQRVSDTYKDLGSIPDKIGDVQQFEEAIDEMDRIIAKTKLEKELQRAEKMNAIGQLAASVAHEIRNPMTVVKGFLQIFLSKDHLSQEELSYIKLMLDELNRAELIINDYLSLAKPDFDSIEKIEANDLASNVMELMNSFAMMYTNIELNTILIDDVWLKGNQNELKQVLINIVKNGIEALETRGSLTMTVKESALYGIFEIRDTGSGMTDEEIRKIGSAFYSLKEKGTGIGLMVCYQIVERMKGRIEVSSKIGEGTTFSIFIPKWEEQ